MTWGPFKRFAQAQKPQYKYPLRDIPQSPIEEQFWQAYLRLQPRALRGLTRQYKVGPYRIDFALPRQRFAIELDGLQSHASTAAMAADRRRERYLMMHGWFIVRFGGQEVYNNPRECVLESEIVYKVWKRGTFR